MDRLASFPLVSPEPVAEPHLYAFEMTMPSGGRVEARRSVTPLRGGLTWVEEEMEATGRLGGPYATGPGWMVEWHCVQEGAVSFVQDGVRHRVEARAFGLLFAPFSVTQVEFEDVRSRWVGVAGEGPRPGRRDAPSILFEGEPDAAPRTAGDLLALLQETPAARSIERCTSPPPPAARAKHQLDATYRTTQPIAALAAQLGVSHPHLTRQFKRAYGMSPVAYRQAVRAGEAMAKLARGERIVDVAGEVGYDDLGRFYKAFRRVMSASPGQCRLP